MSVPCWAAVGRGMLPEWLRPCLDWLCSAVGSVSSTPAAALFQLYPPAAPLPTHSPGRKRSPCSPSLAWKHTGAWVTIVWSDRKRARRGGKELTHLKGASATALVVMVMWSEKSFQVDKKRTETPVWSCRCTTAWWDVRGQNDLLMNTNQSLECKSKCSVR